MDIKRKIVITGATGFIGMDLVNKLIEKNFTIIALSRNPAKHLKQFETKNISIIPWDARTGNGWAEHLEEAGAIINLAGENIGSGIWTAAKKKRLKDSRINAGQAVVEALQRVKNKPPVLIQASAIGFYGSRGNQELTEESDAGEGFLAELTKEWENSVSELKKMETRLVILRIGLVLGKDGGAVAKFKLPFKFFLGGHLGSGGQWMSWIHKEDVINIIIYLMENDKSKGIFNLTSTEPLQSREFFKSIGEALNRPSWLHIPAGALKLIFGEMAEEALLSNQKVLPGRLVKIGYPFKYPRLAEALKDLF